MQKDQFNRLRKLLKEKGTMPIEDLNKNLNCSSVRTRQLLLQYLYEEIGTIHTDQVVDKYKYLFKIFKYFENIDDELEKERTIQKLEESANLCKKRIKNHKKEKKISNNEPDIFKKFLDTIDVTIINLKYKEIAKSTNLQANEVSYELLKYLINIVRNYNYLFELLKLFPNNLTLKNRQGVYLIDELIEKYIDAVQNNESKIDIIYYEKIIKLFVENPKFNIDTDIKNKMVSKLNWALKIINNCDKAKSDKDKSTFFIKEVISDIKKSEELDNNIEHLQYKYDINPDFPAIVLKDSKKMITLEDKSQIMDCRDKYTVTVDCEGTWAYDDACSLERLDNGHYLLGIYVADVTMAVPRNSLVDIEAKKRAESIYSGMYVITMLPYDLTLKLTLKKGNDRNAIGYFFELDENANCVNFSVRRCLINVDENYSYDKVYSMLTDSKNIEEIKNIKDMYYISSKFHQNSDLRMQYRTLKKIKKSIVVSSSLNKPLNHDIAAMMIADFMTQTNAFVADYFYKHPEIPFIYRINLASYGKDIIKNISDISKSEVSFEEMLNYINYICPPSIYSVVNLGHNGLVLPAYCHATNPLRNYSSLENERIIVEHMINDGKDCDLDKSKEYLEKMCYYMNNRISLNNDYAEEAKQFYKKRESVDKK